MTRVLLSKEEKRARARKRWLRWANENREHLRATKSAWKRNNPDKVAAGHRRYAEAHPDKIREKWQRHQSKFPEKGVARQLRYKERNPEKVNAKLRAYFQTHQGKTARVNGQRRRRARKMGSDTIATSKDITKLLNNALACNYCNKSFDKNMPPTIDHVVPLARGGAHSMDNIVAACAACNSKKGISLPNEFLSRISLSCIAVGDFV